MAGFSLSSKRWFRDGLVFFASLVASSILISQLPRAIQGKHLSHNQVGLIVGAEKPFFYSQVVSPVGPQEAIIVKASGEEFSSVQVPKLDNKLLGQVMTTPVSIDPLSSSSEVSAPNLRRLNGQNSPFEVTETLRPAVNFWKKIFAEYGHSQVVMHHRDTLAIVFSVLDFQALENPEFDLSDREIARLRSQFIDLERASIMGDSREFFHQPELLRTQTGIRERFARAIELSGQYMPYIEQILIDANVPVEISRLPFIESSFDVSATSSAGAAGIWQFMEATGKLYRLKVKPDIDERRDPLAATHAAATFFKDMHRDLGTWPLAVNGYNTGHGRILQAMAQLGTDDISVIIEKFKHPAYQFASRNFYPEFLAAVEVYEERSYYFADHEPLPPVQYDVFSPPAPISLVALADYSGVAIEDLKRLNPGLAAHFFSGKKPIRPDFEIKVPYLSSSQFEYAFLDLERLHERNRAITQGRGLTSPRAKEEKRRAVEVMGAGVVPAGSLND